MAEGCDGIVPDSIGNSLTVDVPAPKYSAPRCDNATSDESGNLAFSNEDWNSELYSSDGRHLGSVPADSLFPQGPGFEGVYMRQTEMGPSYPSFAYWAPDGTKGTDTPVGSDEAGAIAYRAWPNGAIALTMHCERPPGRIEIHRFDASGNRESMGTADGGCNILAGGVGDANRSTLAVVQGGNGLGLSDNDLHARWFDRAGNPITEWFILGSGLSYGSAPSDVHKRIAIRAVSGGGAVIRVDGVWQWFLGSGSATVQAAPQWLLDHPQSDFTLVRGARAYAILHRGFGDPDELELYSLQGNRCGSLKFDQGGLTTGADGSVIAASGPAGCHKTIWPGLLR